MAILESEHKTEIIKFQGNDKYLTMLAKYTENNDITYRLLFGPIKRLDFTSESEDCMAGSTIIFGPHLYKLILTLDKKNDSSLFMIDISGPEEYETAIKILENML